MAMGHECEWSYCHLPNLGDEMPGPARRHRSRRKMEEAWIVAISTLVLGSVAMLWFMYVYQVGP
jgi:hypothetical protein